MKPIDKHGCTKNMAAPFSWLHLAAWLHQALGCSRFVPARRHKKVPSPGGEGLAFTGLR